MVDSCQNDLELGNKCLVKYKHFVFFTVIQLVKPSYQLGQVLTKAFHTYYNEKLIAYKRLYYVPVHTSTSNQRWNNVDHQCSSTLFKLLYLVENENWTDVYLSTLFQLWNEVVFSTLKLVRKSWKKYHQNCVWYQPKFNVFSTLNSTLNQCWQHDADSTLVLRQSTSRRYFNIYQHWNNVEYLLGSNLLEREEAYKI